MNGLPTKQVVVPVDFSDESIRALDVGLAMADEPARVRVVHVLPDLNPSDIGVVWDKLDNESRINHATNALRARLVDSKYDNVQIDITIGDPGHRIAEFAEKIEADLIVTPSHGRTGMKRLLIGSVAERVVRLAHCPVLVLRN